MASLRNYAPVYFGANSVLAGSPSGPLPAGGTVPIGGRPARGAVPSVPEGGAVTGIGDDPSGFLALLVKASTGWAGTAPNARTGRGSSRGLPGGVSGFKSCAVASSGVNIMNRAMAIFDKMISILKVKLLSNARSA